MKSLFFIITIALHAMDLKAHVTPEDIKVNMKYHFFSDSESFVEICRGIVIHPKIVMTAAECVNGLVPTDLQVENTWHRVSSNVSNIIIYPDYVEVNGSNNFAILILDKIIIMRKPVACLSNESFLSNADLKTCSATLVTYSLYNRIDSSGDEPRIPLDCESSDVYNGSPSRFRSRQVEIMMCESIVENSQCSTYYFAHYSSQKECISEIQDYPYQLEITNFRPSFVYDVINWVENQFQKYVNGSECYFLTR